MLKTKIIYCCVYLDNIIAFPTKMCHLMTYIFKVVLAERFDLVVLGVSRYSLDIGFSVTVVFLVS